MLIHTPNKTKAVPTTHKDNTLHSGAIRRKQKPEIEKVYLYAFSRLLTMSPLAKRLKHGQNLNEDQNGEDLFKSSLSISTFVQTASRSSYNILRRPDLRKKNHGSADKSNSCQRSVSDICYVGEYLQFYTWLTGGQSPGRLSH
jgi:hypothetical protein